MPSQRGAAPGRGGGLQGAGSHCRESSSGSGQGEGRAGRVPPAPAEPPGSAPSLLGVSASSVQKLRDPPRPNGREVGVAPQRPGPPSAGPTTASGATSQAQAQGTAKGPQRRPSQGATVGASRRARGGAGLSQPLPLETECQAALHLS